jgi:hypothetical protein
MTYKIKTKPRKQEDALNKALHQSFTERNWFGAQALFEKLAARGELKVTMFNSNGEMVDHN